MFLLMFRPWMMSLFFHSQMFLPRVMIHFLHSRSRPTVMIMVLIDGLFRCWKTSRFLLFTRDRLPTFLCLAIVMCVVCMRPWLLDLDRIITWTFILTMQSLALCPRTQSSVPLIFWAVAFPARSKHFCSSALETTHQVTERKETEKVQQRLTLFELTLYYVNKKKMVIIMVQ